MVKYLLVFMLLATPVFADPTPEGSLPIDLGTDVQSEEPAAVQLTNIDPPNWVEKVPPLKNFLLYQPKGNDYSYGALFSAVNWKGINLNIGYSPNDTVIVGVSYDLFTLKKVGVETPILREVGFEPFVGYGLGRIDLKDTSDAEEHLYIGFNILNLRFF